MHTAVLFRRPAWQRRASVVLLPFIVVAVVVLVRYLPAGGRVAPGGFGIAAPVTVGEEFHVGVRLKAAGEGIEVVNVRPVGVSGPVAVDVRVVVESSQVHLGTVRGPLTSDFVVLALPSPGAGLKVSTGFQEPMYSLDVRMIPTAAGVSRVKGVDVTYRDGPLRQRTARLQASVCIDASADWRPHVGERTSTCDPVGP